MNKHFIVGTTNTGSHNYQPEEIGIIERIDSSVSLQVQLRLVESSDETRIGTVGNWITIGRDCEEIDYEKYKKLTGMKINLTFESVILPPDIIGAVQETISQAKEDIMTKIFVKWGLFEVLEKGKGMTMLFYGPPGTGKTLLAEVIASHLNKELKMVDAGTVQTSECGGTERNIKKVFSTAKKKNQVILFDECDSLIFDRSRVGMIIGAEINCLLSEIERFDGVCIFTTNNSPALDKAFERRVSLKIEFPYPNKRARHKIWTKMFPKPKDSLADCVCFVELSKYKMAGGHIKNIALNAARRAAHLDKELIEMEDFLVCLEREEKGMKAFRERRNVQGGQDWTVRRGPTGVNKVVGMS